VEKAPTQSIDEKSPVRVQMLETLNLSKQRRRQTEFPKDLVLK